MQIYIHTRSEHEKCKKIIFLWLSKKILPLLLACLFLFEHPNDIWVSYIYFVQATRSQKAWQQFSFPSKDLINSFVWVHFD